MRVIFLVLLTTAGCATTYQRPTDTGPSAFSFTLTAEQCAELKKERRAYRATEKTAGYVSGAGAVLTGIFLAALEEKTASAAAAGVTLVASGAGVFAGSQVTDLDEELAAGACSR